MITEIVILIVIGVITFVIYITYRNRQGSFTDHGTTVRTQDAVEVDPCEHSASESEHSAEVDPRHHNEPLVSESDLSAEVDGRQHKESVVSKSDLSAELDPCHQEESTESKSNLSAELDPCHQEESPESKSDLSAELDPCHQEESPKSKSDLSAELDPCHQEESPESKSDLSVELDPCYQDELPESKSDLSVELDIKSKVPTHEPSQQMSAKTEDSGVTIADDDDLPSSECTRASAAANIVNLPTADAIKKPPQSGYTHRKLNVYIHSKQYKGTKQDSTQYSL
ncbi:uncharacterized protein LOC121387224 [Gigantopelta aegis]|uniref:uncharacterized protein LOC121387224 n=1 Tax=Gigantopelta aegis TaxID=1735272 RepID=UPI001B88A6AC|nr:uncharacterized protein LOC121387224 [Gigantopelta aegis]